MKLHRPIVTFAAAALLFASVSLAQVKTDYDRNADFAQYKTYSWGNVQTQNPLWVERIKSSINAALAAKGWTMVESGGDIAVMAMDVTRDHQTLNTFYDGFGGGWGWRGWGGLGGAGFGDSTTTTETYKVGTLVVDLFDAKTKQLVWRGSASDTLSDKSGKNIKALDRSVEKLFERFPPEGKK